MSASYLPALDWEQMPPLPQLEGGWADYQHGTGVLSDFARALIVGGEVTHSSRLKSVPSPWARALLFEQALFNKKHPAHFVVQGEWRALLAIIALSEVFGIELQVQRVSLSRPGSVFELMREMLPRDEMSLWDPLVVLKAKKGPSIVPIAATSPSTIVFSSIRGSVPEGVPFLTTGKLQDPTLFYKDSDPEILQMLRKWLDNVEGDMARLPENTWWGRPQANRTKPISLLLGALQDWKRELRIAIGERDDINVSFTSDSRVAAALPQSHPLFMMVKPLRSIEKPQVGEMNGDRAARNDLRLLSASGNTVMVDPGRQGLVSRAGQPFYGRIRLPHGHDRQVENGKLTVDIQKNVDLGLPLIDFSDLFTQRLLLVSNINEGNAVTLEVGGSNILLPFKKEILKYLTPRELETWTRAEGEPTTNVIVTLELPLPDQRIIRFSHEYRNDEVVDDTTGTLAVWPDFQASKWKYYYYFFRRDSIDQKVVFEPVVESIDTRLVLEDDVLGMCTMPINAWRGYYEGDDQAQGLLLMRSLKAIDDEIPAWNISIDFGSTHTRAFREVTDNAGVKRGEPIKINPRGVGIAGSEGGLEEIFFPVKSITDSIEGNQQGRFSVNNEDQSAHVEVITALLKRDVSPLERDGSSYVPGDGVVVWNPNTASFSGDRLKKNLKWHTDNEIDEANFYSFICHFYLLIAAEASAAGSSVRSIRTAYPSVFPRVLRNT